MIQKLFLKLIWRLPLRYAVRLQTFLAFLGLLRDNPSSITSNRSFIYSGARSSSVRSIESLE